ncbi:unnamed protein product [Ceutorhynchus assimilis]|uniref:Uncharacterized protein n=1 Tax=Ceutorhynchus assimilis TaxID=467358 RepID=A0A9N9MFL2_9CUCU|nr:unnamed protein product [Ceutorhynchus assimilis]
MRFLKKTVDKWQKAVADWKSKTKAKVADINKGLTQTGGGGPLPELNENETRLIAILRTTFITGIQTNKELGLCQGKKVPEGQAIPALPNQNSIILSKGPGRISPPPLWPLSYDGNTSINPTSSKSEPIVHIENATSESAVNETDTRPLKEQQIQNTPKKRPWGCTTTTTTQKMPSTNLTDMHGETLKVLK